MKESWNKKKEGDPKGHSLFSLYNTVRMTSEPPPTIVGPSLCGRNGFLMSSRHDYQ